MEDNKANTTFFTFDYFERFKKFIVEESSITLTTNPRLSDSSTRVNQ